MEQRPHKQGDAVSITLPDGRLEGGWKIFMVKEQQGVAILVREVGTDVESREVPLNQIS